MGRLHLAVLALAGLTLATSVAAQPAPPTNEDPAAQLLPEGDDFDPIGTGDTASLRDVRAPEPPRADESHLGPAPPAVAPAEGAILTAVPGVRLTSHRVHVTSEHGMALVRESLQVVSSARDRAEVLLRLAVPSGARVASLRVCGPSDAARPSPDAPAPTTCVEGAPGGADDYDAAIRARPAEAERADAYAARAAIESEVLRVQAAPVVRGETLGIEVTWTAPLSIAGGVARLDIPARGNDLRAQPMQVEVALPGWLAPALQAEPAPPTPRTVSPWEAIAISGAMPSGGPVQLHADVFPCAPASRERCARVFAQAGPRPAQARDVLVWVDVSPSTYGPARGRLPAALGALARDLPADARVRIAAFAGRAEVLISEPTAPADLRLADLARITQLELGASTRFEAAWQATSRWIRRGTDVVVLGDGGLTRGPAAERAVEAFRRRGATLHVVQLDDRPARGGLVALAERTGGRVLDVGAIAGRASRGRDAIRLEEALASIAAPVVGAPVVIEGAERVTLPALRAGESASWTGRIGRGRLRVRAGAQRLDVRRRARSGAPAFVAGLQHEGAWAAVSERGAELACALRGPATHPAGLNSDASPIAPAEAPACMPRPPAPAPRRLGRGVPRETVLTLLRQRLVPAARACFRRDRAGRLDYAVRVVFRFELADGEVVLADVQGEMDDELRTCLSSSLDRLEVPRFEGRVVVRWPVHTARVVPDITVELSGDVAGEVDRAIGPGRDAGIPDLSGP